MQENTLLDNKSQSDLSPQKQDNLGNIKKYYWLDYCQKILMSDVFQANDLVLNFVDSIFEHDISKLENEIKSKPPEEQKLYHFDSESGKIEQYFKLILKTCYLQDVLFQIFSMTEEDVQGFDFKENKLESLNVQSPESFQQVMLAILNSSDKQNFRLQKLDSLILNPNATVAIKMFDEQNEQNKNFVPEERRSLGYSRSFADCLTKIQKEIETKISEFNNDSQNTCNEIEKIGRTKQRLEIEITECQKIMNNAFAKEKSLKNELTKLWKCLNSLEQNNDEPLPFEIEFKKTEQWQGRYSVFENLFQSDYVIQINYKEDKNNNADGNANVNAEGENNNLNNENADNNAIGEIINLNGIEPGDLPKCRDESFKEWLDHKAKLNSPEYSSLRAYLAAYIWLNNTWLKCKDLKIDFPKHYDKDTCQKINEMVKLELKARMSFIKAKIYGNRIERERAYNILAPATNKLVAFDQENQAITTKLENEKKAVDNKRELLKQIGGKIQNINDIDRLKHISQGQCHFVLAQNLIYFDDDQIKGFLDYISEELSPLFYAVDVLKKDCTAIRYYYESIGQELNPETINSLCSGLMKLPSFNASKNKVIEFCEDVCFISDDVKNTRDGCVFLIKAAARIMLFLLICMALSVTIPVIGHHFFSLGLFPISSILSIGFLGTCILLSAGFVAYLFFTNRKAISEYRRYKEQRNNRLKEFYNFDVKNNTDKTYKDFKQNIEKQKHGLELQMGIADKAQEEQKGNQEEKANESINANANANVAPKKMEQQNLNEQKEK